ncbi:MAG: hypothetical protein P8X82_01195 [Gemmatimonadales bacterium]
MSTLRWRCARNKRLAALAAVVDLEALAILRRVETGENLDAILYVPRFDEVYTFNGRGHSATVFEAETGVVVATIPLGGKPEFAVFDPAAQRIYNNIEDTSDDWAFGPHDDARSDDPQALRVGGGLRGAVSG